MTHEELRDRLLDLAYGELPSRDAREVEAHAASCETCGAELARIRGTRRLMASLPQEPAPERGERILLAAAREAARRRAPRGWAPPRWPWATAVAASLFAVAAVSYRIVAIRPDGIGREDPRALLGDSPYARAPADRAPGEGRQAAAEEAPHVAAAPDKEAPEVAAAPEKAPGRRSAEAPPSPPRARGEGGREGAGSSGAAPARRFAAPPPEPAPPAPAPPPAAARDRAPERSEDAAAPPPPAAPPPAAVAPPPPAAAAAPRPPAAAAQRTREAEERPMAAARPHRAPPAEAAAPPQAAAEATRDDAFASAPSPRSAGAGPAEEVEAGRGRGPVAAAEPDARAQLLAPARPAEALRRYDDLRRAGRLRGEVRTFPGCEGETWRKVERDPDGRVVSYAREGVVGGRRARVDVVYGPDGAPARVTVRDAATMAPLEGTSPWIPRAAEADGAPRCTP